MDEFERGDYAEERWQLVDEASRCEDIRTFQNSALTMLLV